jgi:hypothetical protein
VYVSGRCTIANNFIFNHLKVITQERVYFKNAKVKFSVKNLFSSIPLAVRGLQRLALNFHFVSLIIVSITNVAVGIATNNAAYPGPEFIDRTVANRLL